MNRKVKLLVLIVALTGAGKAAAQRSTVLEGRVVDEFGDPMDNVVVSIVRGSQVLYQTETEPTLSGDDVYYRLRIDDQAAPLEDVQLRFESFGYVTRYLGGNGVSGAYNLTIDPGEQSTYNAVTMVPAGKALVTGRLGGPNGVPVQLFRIDTSDGETSRDYASISSGKYSFPITANTPNSLWFRPEDENLAQRYYLDAVTPYGATMVSAEEGRILELVEQRLPLTANEPHRVYGRVTSEIGGAVQGVNVYAYADYSENATAIAHAITRDDGRFEIAVERRGGSALPPEFKLYFNPTDDVHQSEWYPNKTDWTSASYIEGGPGDLREYADAVLSHRGVLPGEVQEPLVDLETPAAPDGSDIDDPVLPDTSIGDISCTHWHGVEGEYESVGPDDMFAPAYIRARVSFGRATVTFVHESNSTYSVGDILWRNLKAASDGPLPAACSLEVRGPNGQYHEATLTLREAGEVTVSLTESSIAARQFWAPWNLVTDDPDTGSDVEQDPGATVSASGDSPGQPSADTEPNISPEQTPAAQTGSCTGESANGAFGFTTPAQSIAAYNLEIEVRGEWIQRSRFCIAAVGSDDQECLANAAARVRPSRDTDTVRLRVPNEGGDYEIRYLTPGPWTIESTCPLALRDPVANIDAPATAEAGGQVTVTCTGDCNANNSVITVVRPDSPDSANGARAALGKTTTVTILRLPKEPGNYELRYRVHGNPVRVIARKPIELQ